ncbi:SPASM domain-containing protein [Nannocystis pusilla]|uniref:SPASM domain-containing protein n=1 Tax=Nannocystis pusilla TaxID=889268 RepID=A0A9X3EZ97_9BACT|nr:SPASM domain-containing protein [Nannocystis pusilla]
MSGRTSRPSSRCRCAATRPRSPAGTTRSRARGRRGPPAGERPARRARQHLPARPGRGRRHRPGGPCPFLGQEAWVSAEGRFDPCCAPDAQRRTLGEFGSLHQHGLMDIWRGEPYDHLVKTYRNRGLCLGCNMRKPVEAS